MHGLNTYRFDRGSQPKEHAESETGINLRVDAEIAQEVGVYHATTEDLDPAAAVLGLLAADIEAWHRARFVANTRRIASTIAASTVAICVIGQPG